MYPHNRNLTPMSDDSSPIQTERSNVHTSVQIQILAGTGDTKSLCLTSWVSFCPLRTVMLRSICPNPYAPWYETPWYLRSSYPIAAYCTAMLVELVQTIYLLLGDCLDDSIHVAFLYPYDQSKSLSAQSGNLGGNSRPFARHERIHAFHGQWSSERHSSVGRHSAAEEAEAEAAAAANTRDKEQPCRGKEKAKGTAAARRYAIARKAGSRPFSAPVQFVDLTLHIVCRGSMSTSTKLSIYICLSLPGVLRVC